MSEDHEYLLETPTESSSPDDDGKFENPQPEVPTQDSMLENWEDDNVLGDIGFRSYLPSEYEVEYHIEVFFSRVSPVSTSIQCSLLNANEY